MRRQNVLLRSSLFLGLAGGLYLLYGDDSSSGGAPGLRALTSSNGTDESGSLYPDDLLLTKPYYDDPHKGLLVFHFLGVLYMFSGLAIVCDDFFVTALDEMVETWEMTPDVAGATLMAAGGSAPELFTSIMGVTVSESDVGFGTIVGSAVFNVLFVIGLCAIFAKQTLTLTWWPLFRDCTFYCFSLLLLAILVGTTSTEAGAKGSGEIEGWEAAVLFASYLLYVLIMKNNNRLKAFAETFISKKTPVLPGNGNGEDERPAYSFTPRRHSALHLIRDVRGAALRHILNGDVETLLETKIRNGHYQIDFKGASPADKLHRAASFVAHQARTHSRMLAMELSAKAKAESDSSTCSSGEVLQQANIPEEEPHVPAKEEGEEEVSNPFEWPDNRPSQMLFLMNLPLQVLLVATIPNCASAKYKSWYIVSFVASLVWIAIFSFFMVWWAEIIGATLGIPPNIMGLTFLAAGTSIPDALSSVIVARQGFGDMAVSSSIGSNIFDILFGLPVPWLLKTCVLDKINTGSIGVVVVKSPYLITNVLTLLLMVAFVILSIMSFNWKLTKGLGCTMFILYILFLAMSLSLEYCDTLGLC